MEKLNPLLPNEPKPNALVAVQTTDDVFLLCFRKVNETDFTVYATAIKIHRFNVKLFQYIVNEFNANIFIDDSQQKRIPIYRA